MSIQTEINRIVAAKEAIVAALTEKGVSVGGGKLDKMAALIDTMKIGNGQKATGTYIATSTTALEDYSSVRVPLNINFEPVSLLFYLAEAETGSLPSASSKRFELASCVLFRFSKGTPRGFASGMIYDHSKKKFEAQNSYGGRPAALALHSFKQSSFYVYQARPSRVDDYAYINSGKEYKWICFGED